MGIKKRITKKLKKLVPYWLRRGDRTCASCGGSHAHHVEARCVACDRPHCSFCVMVIGGEVFCPGCAAEEAS